ncbi:unnamed protein product [Darwinula stevensoni]|uniref:Protein kinase domain-containing protein n=1 Tax=Darwinula stevensoni TaxID=69355 RepID=A0A7R9ABZ4_9CRUS|nr:unnamed protein product [Darwinula stevensoni]CAG0899634.1 unnamed protein product [Darwinula stevensoni]
MCDIEPKTTACKHLVAMTDAKRLPPPQALRDSKERKQMITLSTDNARHIEAAPEGCESNVVITVNVDDTWLMESMSRTKMDLIIIDFLPEHSQLWHAMQEEGHLVTEEASEDIRINRSTLQHLIPSGVQVFESRLQRDFINQRRVPGGKGGFGVVFRAQNKLDNHSYAIKRIRLLKSEKERAKASQEVKALVKLQHQSIVRYYASWVDDVPDGWKLEDIKVTSTSTSEDKSATSSEGESNKSAFTPSNILFDEKQRVKVGDFGLVLDVATLNTRGTSHPVGQVGSGTELYMSPEQVLFN